MCKFVWSSYESPFPHSFPFGGANCISAKFQIVPSKERFTKVECLNNSWGVLKQITPWNYSRILLL